MRHFYSASKFFLKNVFNKNMIITKSSFSKVPQVPTTAAATPAENTSSEKIDEAMHIDCNLVDKLERLALVDFENEVAVERLKETIQSVKTIFTVDTTNVEPMVTLLEDRCLYLRKDEITEKNSRKEILQNASVTVEDYFVAPPGNIPLKKGTK